MAYNILYVIKAFGSNAGRMRWPLFGEPLIKRTVKLIESISKNAKMIILTDNASQIQEVCGSERIVETMETSAPLKNESKITQFDALVFIEPLRPFVLKHDLENALSKYFCQDTKKRRTLVSVSSVPNQYHPRKILDIDIDGWLKYYDDSGKRVYQRQQIEDDPYYVINDAIRITIPKNAFEDAPDGSYISVVIEKAIFYVQTRDDLEFASALMKNSDTLFRIY